MGCQSDIANAILEQEADYMLALNSLSDEYFLDISACPLKKFQKTEYKK
jgi:hypothetical protein